MDERVYVVGGALSYIQLFESLGMLAVDSPEEATVVVFTGGADVGPEIYGHTEHPETGTNPMRDKHEIEIYNNLDPSIIKVGICRGAQFLHAMNGGKLFQDVTRHCQDHIIYSILDGEVFEGCTSTHHQMMVHNKGILMAYGIQGGTKERHINGEIVRGGTLLDPEVILHMDTTSICFQPHPEFLGADSTKKLFEHVYRKTFVD